MRPDTAAWFFPFRTPSSLRMRCPRNWVNFTAPMQLVQRHKLEPRTHPSGDARCRQSWMNPVRRRKVFSGDRGRQCEVVARPSWGCSVNRLVHCLTSKRCKEAASMLKTGTVGRDSSASRRCPSVRCPFVLAHSTRGNRLPRLPPRQSTRRERSTTLGIFPNRRGSDGASPPSIRSSIARAPWRALRWWRGVVPSWSGRPDPTGMSIS